MSNMKHDQRHPEKISDADWVKLQTKTAIHFPVRMIIGTLAMFRFVLFDVTKITLSIFFIIYKQYRLIFVTKVNVFLHFLVSHKTWITHYFEVERKDYVFTVTCLGGQFVGYFSKTFFFFSSKTSNEYNLGERFKEIPTHEGMSFASNVSAIRLGILQWLPCESRCVSPNSTKQITDTFHCTHSIIGEIRIYYI